MRLLLRVSSSSPTPGPLLRRVVIGYATGGEIEARGHGWRLFESNCQPEPERGLESRGLGYRV